AARRAAAFCPGPSRWPTCELVCVQPSRSTHQRRTCDNKLAGGELIQEIALATKGRWIVVACRYQQELSCFAVLRDYIPRGSHQMSVINAFVLRNVYVIFSEYTAPRGINLA